MTWDVKNLPDDVPARGAASRTRISPKHQVTIPRTAFREAGLAVGETLRVEAIGPGRLVLTRQDLLLQELRGTLHAGGELRRAIEELRDEWP